MSFIVVNGTNREWSTTEELDLPGYASETPGVDLVMCKDYALVHADDDETINCFLWAIGDNLYVAQSNMNHAMIYWSNSLKDAFDFAAEAVNLAER
jgi:hypothetical protein